jgi:hypothetical protein
MRLEGERPRRNPGPFLLAPHAAFGDGLTKSNCSLVIPAKAGIQEFQQNKVILDTRIAPLLKLRRHAVAGMTTFCKSIKNNNPFLGDSSVNDSNIQLGVIDVYLSYRIKY